MDAVVMRDDSAYAELVSRHLGGVHSYLYRMSQNRSDAEELAQEAFLRVWSRAST